MASFNNIICAVQRGCTLHKQRAGKKTTGDVPKVRTHRRAIPLPLFPLTPLMPLIAQKNKISILSSVLKLLGPQGKRGALVAALYTPLVTETE